MLTKATLVLLMDWVVLESFRPWSTPACRRTRPVGPAVWALDNAATLRGGRGLTDGSEDAHELGGGYAGAVGVGETEGVAQVLDGCCVARDGGVERRELVQADEAAAAPPRTAQARPTGTRQGTPPTPLVPRSTNAADAFPDAPATPQSMSEST